MMYRLSYENYEKIMKAVEAHTKFVHVGGRTEELLTDEEACFCQMLSAATAVMKSQTTYPKHINDNEWKEECINRVLDNLTNEIFENRISKLIHEIK